MSRAAALDVEVQFAARRPWVPSPAALRRWAGAAHDAALARPRPKARGAAAPARLCIRIVGSAAGRRLNAGYRGKDRPTNVLSFPASALERALDGALGDLVICAPVVAQEAKEQAKSPAAHWAHLTVHGLLHLLGFDHQHEGEAAEMEKLEAVILAELGYPDPYLTGKKA